MLFEDEIAYLSNSGDFAGRYHGLAATTDGVGTKAHLAHWYDRLDGLGQDVVHQNINDLLCVGALPEFFLDYIGGSLPDEKIISIVRAIRDACNAVGAALIGGETARLTTPLELVGFAVGSVRYPRREVDGGEVLWALPSNGLHTNGYTVAMNALGIPTGLPDHLEQLLLPHTDYVTPLKPYLGAIHCMAHITGGGLAANIPRMLPPKIGFKLDYNWPVPAIFSAIQARGVSEEEMYKTFNMGLGIVFASSEPIPGAFKIGVTER